MKPKRIAFSRKVQITLIAVLGVVVFSAFFVNYSIQSIVSEISSEAQPDQRLVLLKQVMYDISNAESSVKSFGLTQDENYLDRYNESFEHANQDVAYLYEAATEDDPFRNKIIRLDTLVNRKFNVLDELLIVQNLRNSDKLIEKVKDKVHDAGEVQESHNEMITASVDQEESEPKEEEEKDRFFKRVFGNRKKKKKRQLLLIQHKPLS